MLFCQRTILSIAQESLYLYFLKPGLPQAQKSKLITSPNLATRLNIGTDCYIFHSPLGLSGLSHTGCSTLYTDITFVDLQVTNQHAIRNPTY
jgi:hypothetical protein